MTNLAFVLAATLLTAPALAAPFKTKLKSIDAHQTGVILRPLSPLPEGPKCRKFNDQVALKFDASPIAGYIYGTCSGSGSTESCRFQGDDLRVIAGPNANVQARVTVATMAMFMNQSVLLSLSDNCTDSGVQIAERVNAAAPAQ